MTQDAGTPEFRARERRHRHRRTPSAGGWRIWSRRTGRAVAALVSLTLLIGFGYGWYSYRSLDTNLRRVHIAVSKPHNQVSDGKAQNILVAGNDDRSDLTPAELALLHTGTDGGSLATDSMMIVHVPADGSRATLISLPRDSYVAIPGFRKNKLNSAYADGFTNSNGTHDQKVAAGAGLLMQTVQDLTGLSIDHFVMVNLIGFVRISDAIGGVSVNLCNAVDDSAEANRRAGLDGGSGLVLSAGVHVIQGPTALEFVRQRHFLPNGDIDRAARQRYFLTAAFRKIATAGTLLNPGKLSALITAVDNSLYVDQNFDLLSFARQMSGLNANNIKGAVIPYIPDQTAPGAGSVEFVDPAQVRQFMAHLIGQGQAVLGSVAAASPGDVTVRVQNGGSQDGAAQRDAELLKGYGFTASYSSAATTSAATTVQYAKGTEAQVKALLKYLPANVVLQQADVPAVTLVLGQDGLGVNPPASAGPTGSASPTGTTTKPPDAGCIN